MPLPEIKNTAHGRESNLEQSTMNRIDLYNLRVVRWVRAARLMMILSLLLGARGLVLVPALASDDDKTGVWTVAGFLMAGMALCLGAMRARDEAGWWDDEAWREQRQQADEERQVQR
jgi:hypothetical protein